MRKNNPRRLFTICCDFLIPKFEESAKNSTLDKTLSVLLQTSGGYIAQEILFHAVQNANRNNKSSVIWKREWNIFLTENIKSALISWDEEVIHKLQFCQSLYIVFVVHFKDFDASLIQRLPESVIYLEFQDEREVKMSSENEGQSWLSEAEEILKTLVNKKQIPSVQNAGANLTEIHLSSVPATTEDIQSILKTSPGLKILRHYQMVKALYDLHSAEWKRGEKTPVYKLRNLDADFSHVVRCRMTPGWVLSPDSFHLVTLLCPQADQVHLRFDCSTPNDVLGPLVNLAKLKKFSAVCVTSGERSLLDFSDMAPILEKHGPEGLAILELKVIEEVEVHVIIEQCTKLETLILSGCGYVTPVTCGSYECARYRPGTFTQLRHLFFADGDDFSWDHGAPECFWKAALLPTSQRDTPLLEGIFLEYPRIPDALTSQIFRRGAPDSQLPLPELKVASLCRYGELTLEDVTAMCGLGGKTSPPINFLRISNCEKWEPNQEKQLRNWFKQQGVDCQVQVDGSGDETEATRPYTFKIYRPR